MRFWTPRVPVLLAALGLGASTPGEGTAAPQGATVTKPNGITIRRLGDVAPKNHQHNGADSLTISVDVISSAPIVLEAAGGEPAVLYSRMKSSGLSMVGGFGKQEIGVVSPGVFKLGAFPIVNHAVEAPGIRPDLIDHVVAADLDGDGYDELIALYGPGSDGSGTVEVYSARKRLARWEGRTREHYHSLMSYSVSRLGKKDVVLIALERSDRSEKNRDADEKKKLPEPYALLRVDAQGITEIRLRDMGFDVTKVVGAGVISRPGSERLDEMVVALEKRDDGDGLYVSRHAPDGSILDAPRRMTASGYDGHTFYSLPGRDAAVSWNGNEANVFAPSRPTGWAASFNLTDAVSGVVQFLGVADRAQPKIMYRSQGQKQIFALDLQGHQMVRRDGSWKEGPMGKPFFDLPESEPGQSLDDVILSRDGGALILVESRNHSIRALTMSEYLAAAERFLPVEQLAVLKKKADVELPRDGYQLAEIEEECKKAGIAHPIRSVGEWKRLLPKSYQSRFDWNQTNLHSEIKSALTEELRYGHSLHDGKFREPGEYRAWLDQLDLPARTTFTILRDGEPAGSFSIAGAIHKGDMHGSEEHPLTSRIHWEPLGMGARVVLALDDGEVTNQLDGSPEMQGSSRLKRVDRPLGFYLIEWRPSGDATK